MGSVYLATQNENPFHTLLAGYIVIDDPTTGVVVKIPGNLTPNPATGQITGVFDEDPQFPVSELKLHFFGGARGELATPDGLWDVYHHERSDAVVRTGFRAGRDTVG